MKAVVMAGGEGSRLRPLTLERPKPMLPVVNRPVLGHILYLLKQHGIKDVVITVQYLAAQIQDAFGDGKALGMNIEYVVEETPLGHGGQRAHALPLLDDDEPFLVISGDALTDFDLTDLMAFHRNSARSSRSRFTDVSDPLEYGVINVDRDGPRDAVSGKAQLARGALRHRQHRHLCDRAGSVGCASPPTAPWTGARKCSRRCWPGGPMYGYVAKGYWCDIGTLAEYRRANTDLLNGRLNMGELGRRIGPGIWAGGAVDIDARMPSSMARSTSGTR